MRRVAIVLSFALLAGCSASQRASGPDVTRNLPEMGWGHRAEADSWTAAGLAAMERQGKPLLLVVPADIARFCPTYAQNDKDDRAAFWVGLFSALAKHESTWRPDAVGGGGQWFGLTQIAPATARAYGCKAKSGSALTDGSDNIACAIRIAAYQVPRDGYLVSDGDGWRGMARDWAPFRSKSMRAEMAAFTSRQPYCR